MIPKKKKKGRRPKCKFCMAGIHSLASCPEVTKFQVKVDYCLWCRSKAHKIQQCFFARGE